VKIRTRLTLFYTITFAFIMIVFSGLIYLGMRIILFNEIDNSLNRHADTIAQSYPGTLSIFQSLDWSDRIPAQSLPMSIEILSSNGEVLYRSEAAKSINLHLMSSRIKTTFRFMNYKIEQIREVITTKEPVDGSRHFRVLMKKFYYKDAFVGWIQVVQPVDHIVRQLGALKRVLFTALFICLIIVSVSGYILSKSSLKPMQAIIVAANRISHSNLSERIKPLENKDEIQDLADTLNSLFDRLDNAFQSQKQFISDAAHELRTPLAILRTGIESEIGNKNIDTHLRDMLLQNLDTISRLSSLVEKLLLLSRLENARIEERRIPADIGEMLSKAGEDIGMMADEKEQVLEIRSEEGLLVNADADLLYQAVFNILTNAVKYTPVNGRVKAEAKKMNGHIKIEVCDNGIGINQKDLKLVFNRFYRADRSRGKEKGYGLGLAITRQIILLHKGTIDINSVEGKGTTITVLLPKIDTRGEVTS